MVQKKATAASRAWGVLRLALLWARKGGALRRWRLMLGLRVALKSLPGAGGGGAGVERVRYMERELSFDETPTFGFRMSRPASLRFPKIPCMRTPSVDLDEEDWIFYEGERECKFFEGQERDDHDHDDESGSEGSEEVEEEEGEGIDSKAEKFIANFYEQMKLQRQVSLIQFNDMLQRGAN
ncbi:uncharacterized protein M6B38_159010 [Iris pallida]|uniref:Uncharacterized protein n=1 Tax=Iris pallida TaxID=29817 RepID=A0AAX6F2H8_IRIPA|nr:uncharacterized protein M6B38_159005 [Iris pallida]KAJ6810348.1 uncharacterized protein M6B38_159010 [Iris pallida]